MLRKISLVIAEAALETVPKKIMDHPSVKNYSNRIGKRPTETLLDRSYHHAAMVHPNLKLSSRRGRPDLIHISLLEALSTPLFFEGLLKVYVHTINDKVIFIGENLRLPKSYFRFEGLMMTLFKNKIIKGVCSERNYEDIMLLQLREGITFEALIKEIVKPDKLVGLSSIGIRSTAENVVATTLAGYENDNSFNVAFVIGGFPRGHFSDKVSELFDKLYSIGVFKLESHIVIARILYECEKALFINDKVHQP
jgi:rRNA small subunit pseudouridine methyltransferase Nep1